MSAKTESGPTTAEVLNGGIQNLDAVLWDGSIEPITLRMLPVREYEAFARALENEGQVLSTGGGAVIRDENRKAFKQNGVTICLTARPEVIYARIRHETHRPLLQVPEPLAKIRDLLAARSSFYHQADFIIDTSDLSVDGVINEIKEKVRYACC